MRAVRGPLGAVTEGVYAAAHGDFVNLRCDLPAAAGIEYTCVPNTAVFEPPTPPTMPHPPPITEAEWAVMDALWQDSPRSAQEVHETLDPRHDWTLGTVKTLLARLLKKDAVRHDKEGKRYFYRPAVTRQACVRAAGKDLLKRAGREAQSPLLAYFLKESRIGKDEIRELRVLLDKIEEEQS